MGSTSEAPQAGTKPAASAATPRKGTRGPAPSAERSGASIRSACAIGRGRKRPEENAVDDAEDRGVGAHAQRDGRDDDGREPGLAPEAAQRVADVLEDPAHAGHSSRRARIGSMTEAR